LRILENHSRSVLSSSACSRRKCLSTSKKLSATPAPIINRAAITSEIPRAAPHDSELARCGAVVSPQHQG
jgi:hypothetical protein